MTNERLLGDLREADAADFRRDAGEGEIDHLRADADGFEGLCTLVGIEHRDAHLRHDLEHAFFERLAVVGHRLLGGDFAELVLPGIRGDELADGGVAEVGADRGRAETEAAGDLVHVADFAGFDHQRGAHALADAVEVVMDGADGEQGGNGDALGGSGAVGEDEDVAIVLHGRFSFGAEFVEARLSARPLRSAAGHVQSRTWPGIPAHRDV